MKIRHNCLECLQTAKMFLTKIDIFCSRKKSVALKAISAPATLCKPQLFAVVHGTESIFKYRIQNALAFVAKSTTQLTYENVLVMVMLVVNILIVLLEL